MIKTELKYYEQAKREERQEKFESQAEYCDKMLEPLFIIGPEDSCECGAKFLDYYTLDECRSKLLSSCPKCNRSLIE